jgi:hypothetical protein
MTDPEFSDRGASLDPAERDIEAPDADALEQQMPADPHEAAAVQPPQRSSNPEVSEWDALEQAQVVDLDDDY